MNVYIHFQMTCEHFERQIFFMCDHLNSTIQIIVNTGDTLLTCAQVSHLVSILLTQP